jgi:RNA recognition motif-containing protein
VGNLDFDTTQNELQVLFAEAGEVVSVTLPISPDSGRGRGFAFVEMSTDEQAATAMEKFNGFALNGRTIRVDTATARPGGPAPHRARGFAPGPRSRPKGSRRNLRARKRGF